MNAGQGYLLRNILLFGRLLRGLGINATPTQIHHLIAALEFIDLRRRDDVKNAARTALVNRPEHIPLFDRAFDLFWQTEDRAAPFLRPRAPREPARHRQTLISARAPRPGRPPPPETDRPPADRAGTYSPRDVLRRKDFAAMTPDELDEIGRLMRRVVWQPDARRTRRTTPTPRGAHLDMRRTLRRNLRHGGELLQLTRRARKCKPRPLVAICDISGSMARYSRILLKFVYLISRGVQHVEAFAFGTRLTRLTRPLKTGTADAALAHAAAAIDDWGGGTRTGEALKTFNYRWARRVLGRGAVVLIISDGWDRGDVGLLGKEMRRLQRSCHRLIWLNPLLGSPGYRPLTRGMQAALPHVDEFLPVHNLASLEQLARFLFRRPVHRLHPLI